jgi:hypothetical protein
LDRTKVGGFVRFRRVVLGLVLAVVAVLLLLGAGCSSSKPTAPTSTQAKRAFEAMYPGLLATSAEPSGTAWTVVGYAKTNPDLDSTIPVQVAVSPDATGVVSASVDGLRWTGKADLELLLESRSDSTGTTSSIADALFSYIEDARIVDVQRAVDGQIRVSVVTSEGPQPPFSVYWDSSWDGWSVSGGPQPADTDVKTLPAHLPPTKTEAGRVIREFVTLNGDNVHVVSMQGPRIAKHTKGRWWASAVVRAKGQDDVLVYIVGEHRLWTLFDMGTGIDRSELPADVRNRLGDWSNNW